MGDTRKIFGRGVGLTGFKPSQPPYMVGPDKKIIGVTTHITLDGFDGTDSRKVRSFHISFKGYNPQPVAKWGYNGTTNTYEFKGWANLNILNLDAAQLLAVKKAVSTMAKGGVSVFGNGCKCSEAT